MDMAVDKAGGQIAAPCINDLGFGADAVGDIADGGDGVFSECDSTCINLARVGVDDPAVGNEQVGPNVSFGDFQ